MTQHIKNKWGFLREHSSLAIGYDSLTGLNRTGLDEYLSVIFPNTNDWIHDKAFISPDGIKYKIRPDYRSESLKLIVEFDGIQHYNDPNRILTDIKNTEIYEKYGYNVVRIPYFIQLTNNAVETLFGIDIKERLFDVKYPSLGGEYGKHNPACLCPAGLARMAKEFKKFPDQYNVNIESLKNMNNDYLSGLSYLENEYNKLY